MKKPKKFNLDRELMTLAEWSASGGVWRAYKGVTSEPTPDCTAEKPCLRTGWFTFGGDNDEVAYEYVSFTVSNGHRVIAQGFDNAFHARLIAASPELLRFVKDIADGESLALSVVGEAKALLKRLREPVDVPTLHDSTHGPYNPADYSTEFHPWS